MDLETKTLLEQWGVGELQNIFEEQGIDVMALRLLTENDIHQIIPKVGIRAKFRANLEIWKNNLSEALSTESIDEGERNTLIDISNSFLGVNNAIIKETELGGPEPLHNNLFQEVTEQENLVLVNQSANRSNINSTEWIADEAIEVGKNFVVNVLKSSADGRAIVISGQSRGGLLIDSERRLVGRLIIAELLKTESARRIQSVEFTRLAVQVGELFKKEAAAVFFASSLAETKYQKKKNASGILYEAYITRRRKLRSLGELPTPQKRSRTSSQSSTVSILSLSSSSTVDITDDPIVEEKLNWLYTGISPWALVEINWTETVAHRLSQLSRETGNVDSYFKKFPAIHQPEGYRLLIQDFLYLYPDKEHHLFSKLVIHRNRIIQLAEQKLKQTRDKDIKLSITTYLNYSADDTTEARSKVALLLLPYIISIPPTRKKQGQTVWKPSRAEIRDSFITQVSSANEVKPCVEERKNKLQRLGRSFQPLVVFVGPNVAEISAAYVVVDNTYYLLRGLVEAVDTIFKIFHATGAEYPEESYDIWLMIQKGFYEITTPYDRPNQAFKSLMTDLELSLDKV